MLDYNGIVTKWIKSEDLIIPVVSSDFISQLLMDGFAELDKQILWRRWHQFLVFGNL